MISERGLEAAMVAASNLLDEYNVRNIITSYLAVADPEAERRAKRNSDMLTAEINRAASYLHKLTEAEGHLFDAKQRIFDLQHTLRKYEP